MSLLPTPAERIARARGDLQLGLPVALHGAGRTVVVLAADGVTAARLDALRGLGGVRLVLSDWRARTLRLRVYDGDLSRMNLPSDADVDWVRGIIDPAQDLRSPMKGPLREVRDGGDAGLERLALRLMKGAQLLPAALIAEVEVAPDGLDTLDASVIGAALDAAPGLTPVAAARVPLSVSTAGRVHVFRPTSGGPEHVGVEIGAPSRSKPVLARLHSACLTGDVLGSVKCDCGPQLHAALQAMGDAGEGVLLYLSQEGRGIGLANKMRAYDLQDQGFDTVEANHRLGFEDDERDFRIGADLLKRLGFGSVRLMTNNPAKVAMLERHGITVTERVPLSVGRRAENAHYLDTKAKKSGHLL